jgi:2',5'-phosphodiesterase
MSRTAAAAVRVVSYNVLSPHLASPSHFSTLNPEHLEATTRLAKILTKLEQEIGSSENRATVFCLQEISYDWAGPLHSFFAQHNYHVVTGLYGKKFNGYMGVLTAYPTDKLETVQVDICRLSDTYEQWPEKPIEGTLQRIIRKIALPPLKFLGLHKEEPESHWSIAQRRYNVLLTAVLKDKSSSQQFCVGNYHMPCCYYAPMVMTMHSDLCLCHVQKIAGDDNPYILAGDFNIKPTESSYKLLTTGELATSDPSYPTPPLHAPEFTWKPTMQEPVQSAYAIANGGVEPDFTNYARVQEQEPFIDTLDYIFISDGVSVQSVLELPHRDTAGGPFPNESEPSDHILIGANLDVSSRSSSSAAKE